MSWLKRTISRVPRTLISVASLRLSSNLEGKRTRNLCIMLVYLYLSSVDKSRQFTFVNEPDISGNMENNFHIVEQIPFIIVWNSQTNLLQISIDQSQFREMISFIFVEFHENLICVKCLLIMFSSLLLFVFVTGSFISFSNRSAIVFPFFGRTIRYIFFTLHLKSFSIKSFPQNPKPKQRQLHYSNENNCVIFHFLWRFIRDFLVNECHVINHNHYCCINLNINFLKIYGKCRGNHNVV